MRDFEWLTGLYRHQRVETGPYKGRRPWIQYSNQFNETRFYVLHMDFLRLVRNRFLRSPSLQSNHWAIVRPTNGAFTVFLALQLCDKVDAYGFITEDHKKFSNYYFERGAKTHVVFYANHNYNQEMALWKTLHDKGIIHLYQGEGREPETTQAKAETIKRPNQAKAKTTKRPDQAKTKTTKRPDQAKTKTTKRLDQAKTKTTKRPNQAKTKNSTQL
uniref:alpha-N-acetylgalactosaminide alpha-2,6-sialyltransferase n=1 Tax=Knipowitschia caucasica TaxID=637954 RepID=A0AAV2LAY0_KNICA